MSKKIQKFFAILIFSFSFPVFAVTLLESTTAVGIANTIQGTGQVANPQQILHNVRNTVNQASQPVSVESRANPALQEYYNRMIAGNALNQPVGKRGNVNPENLQNLSREQMIRQSLSDGEINPENFSAGSVEYKSKTVIFYKKDCRSPATSCQRSHPVFTNLKSVIFDYNHNRMDYQK